ncbi:MAG: hypothetical protein ABIH11_01625 [Candidatus Altiarchaeota archaeon]
MGVRNVFINQHETEWLILHSIDEAVFLADRALVLKDGRIMGEHAIELSRPRSPDVKFTKRFNDIKKVISESIYSSPE